MEKKQENTILTCFEHKISLTHAETTTWIFAKVEIFELGVLNPNHVNPGYSDDCPDNRYQGGKPRKKKSDKSGNELLNPIQFPEPKCFSSIPRVVSIEEKFQNQPTFRGIHYDIFNRLG